jgi:hypothetical protein
MARRHGLLFVLLVACATAIGVPAAQAATVAFDLKIERGRVPENMRRIRVEQGDIVTLRWSVDQPAILHLHGYEIEQRIEPGTVGEMIFTARATGRFPVHIHDAESASSKRAHEEAPLLYVEVYPH